MRSLLLLCSLFLLSACAGAEVTTGSFGDEPFVVRTGTSFGMCLGYCSRTLEIAETEMVFRESSREPDRYPARTRSGTITRQEWDTIAALAGSREFAALQESYGCPDCADGGAEFIEVERDGRVQRVVFEYGDTLPGVAALQARLRALRGRFEER